jgi:hypothetical protein
LITLDPGPTVGVGIQDMLRPRLVMRRLVDLGLALLLLGVILADRWLVLVEEGTRGRVLRAIPAAEPNPVALPQVEPSPVAARREKMVALPVVVPNPLLQPRKRRPALLSSLDLLPVALRAQLGGERTRPCRVFCFSGTGC